jgi:2-polyprenyl-6-methoxyphenol hydroxylase-like FAD-dependent oxidoreductase
MGALRSDVADVLADELGRAGVDVRLRTTVTALDDRGDAVVATLSDGTGETVDLVVGADGIRSQIRRMIGIDAEPQPVGMGIWRVVARRPPEMECSELYQGGPKYRAGYTPISESLCYAFLLEGNLDRSFVGEHPNGKVFKAHGEGYGGTWGKVRDSLADDAVVNYQWIEAVRIEGPWHRGRTVLIGDAVHAPPPTLAAGAAIALEDAVVLDDMLAEGGDVEATLRAFVDRRFDRCKLVVEQSVARTRGIIDPTPDFDVAAFERRVWGELAKPY